MNMETPSPDDIRSAALEDGSGFSSYIAHHRHPKDSEGFVDEDRPQASGIRKVRRPRPTGRSAVEISGQDESIRIAKQEAKDHPDPRTPDEIRASAARGAALARAALPSDVDKALAELDEEISSADQDYRVEHETAAVRAFNARMRTIADRK